MIGNELLNDWQPSQHTDDGKILHASLFIVNIIIINTVRPSTKVRKFTRQSVKKKCFSMPLKINVAPKFRKIHGSYHRLG